jgi:hypothetical protein
MQRTRGIRFKDPFAVSGVRFPHANTTEVGDLSEKGLEEAVMAVAAVLEHSYFESLFARALARAKGDMK